MSSFESYKSFCERAKMDKHLYANQIVEELKNELLDTRSNVEDIEIFAIAKSYIAKSKNYEDIVEREMYVYDLCYIIEALARSINSAKKSDANIPSKVTDGFFGYRRLNNDDIIQYLNNTEKKISTIEMFLKENLKHSRTHAGLRVPKISKDIFNSNDSKDKFSEAPIVEDDFNLHSQENNENQLVDSIASRNSSRRKENMELVEKWHSDITEINDTLKSIQPDVSKMLETIMNFSNKITEEYVLQFAKMQIDLYNYVTDLYPYHKKASLDSKNQDYINAVDNYEEILYSISDSLAVFGVEEIVSSSGDEFDGKIHESNTKNFSSRNSIIKHTLRSGYRYKDIVIQKELVEVQESLR